MRPLVPREYRGSYHGAHYPWGHFLGPFALQTYGNMALEVQGGYNFGGSISFGLYNQSILENQNLPIQFLSASMTIRDVFSLPVNIVYFVGQNDTFGSGSGFADFGAPPIMTRYRGFLYFPNNSTDPINPADLRRDLPGAGHRC